MKCHVKAWNMALGKIGIMLSQAKECLGLLEAGKGRKNPPLEASKRAESCQHLMDFGTPAL